MTDAEKEAIERAWTKHCETVTWPEESANHRKAFTAGYLACQQAADVDLGRVLAAFSLADARVGCGDNSCLFVKPGGMATNGGCRCVERPGVPAAIAKLYKAVAELIRPSKQEGLHDKAAIAEQLAWRDQQIEALRADRVHLEEAARLLRAGESGFGDEGIDFRTRQHGDRLHAWLERERLRRSKQGEGT